MNNFHDNCTYAFQYTPLGFICQEAEAIKIENMAISTIVIDKIGFIC